MPTNDNPFLDLVPEQDEAGQIPPIVETAPVPTATNEKDANPFLEVVPSISDAEKQMRASVSEAWQHDPDRVGKALGLSHRTGLPSDYVERNFDSVVREADFDSVDFREIERENPVLAEWLRDYQHAAIARDDIGVLQRLERAAKASGDPSQYGYLRSIASGGVQGFRDLSSTGAAAFWGVGIYDNETLAQVLAAHNAAGREFEERSHPAAQALQEARADVAARYGQAKDQILAMEALVDRMVTGEMEIPDEWDIVDHTSNVLRGLFRGRNIDNLDELTNTGRRVSWVDRRRIREALINDDQFLMEHFGEEFIPVDEAARQASAAFRQVFIDSVMHPRGFLVEQVRQFPNSIPSILTGLASGVIAAKATGPLAPVTIPIAGAGGGMAAHAPVEYGGWIMQEISKNVEDPTDESQILALLNDPGFKQRVREEARRKGLTHAAVEGAFNAFSGHIGAGATRGIRRNLPSSGRLATPSDHLARVAGTGVDALTQATGAGLGSAAGQMAAVGHVDAVEAAMEFVGELGGGAVRSMVMQSLYRSIDATAKAADMVTDSLRTVSAQEAFLESVGLLRSSKAMQRSPEAVDQFMQGAMPEDARVHIGITEWEGIAQRLQADPVDLANSFGIDNDTYMQAAEEGNELSMPMAQLAESLAAIDESTVAEITESMRFENMTPREAKALAKQAQNEMQAAMKEAQANIAKHRDEFNRIMQEIQAEERPQASDIQGEVTLESFSNSIARQVEMELQRAGQDRNLARRNAALMTAYWTTMARRSEMPLETLREMQPMIIGAAQYSRADAILDRLRAESLPTDAEMFGPSLVDFLVQKGGLIDSGGELAGLEAGRARPGLVNKAGLTLDQAAEMAAEMGYPVRNDMGTFDTHMLVDAIANDLAGNRVSSIEMVNDPAVQLRAEMDELAAMLDRMGINLSEMNNEEVRRAITQRMDEDQLNQVDPSQAPMAETIDVDGVQRSTTNSRGKRIAANEEAVRNFWRWFGDSKVVDEQGRPLVVYHGTASKDIAEFRPVGGIEGEWQDALNHFRQARDENKSYGYMLFRDGTFFSPKAEYAGRYAGEGKGVIYPAYIMSSNPIYIEQTTGDVTGVNPDITPDSLIMHRYGDINEVSVIDPTQIKSATGNIGTFDASDPNILRQPSVTSEALPAPSAPSIMRHLSESERGKLTDRTTQRLVDIFGELPADTDFAAAAQAGIAKRGWYERSAQAIRSIFGDSDGPRFVRLLAATSPQTSVEMNLQNAMAIWTNWTAAGRPTDRAEIIEIMGQSVAGDKGVDSVLDAWINNTVRALSAEDPTGVVLSGPKVNSFALNLVGVSDEVTNDAWMANFALVDQTIFSGSLNVKGTDPGKGSGYLAMNAKVRRVAKRLTKETGEQWTPAEVQETVWSWAKTAYEMAEREGVTVEQLVRDGRITDELVAETPDFATLFTDNTTYRAMLEEAGYGDVIRGFEADQRAGRESDAAADAEGAGARGQAAPVTPALLRSARRLDKLARQRRTKKEAERRRKGRSAAQLLMQPAFHGTGFSGTRDQFGRFRTDMIGSEHGEGMQAFGWGLYFTDSRQVAEHYRDKLAGFAGTIKGKNLAQWQNELMPSVNVSAENVSKALAIGDIYSGINEGSSFTESIATVRKNASAGMYDSADGAFVPSQNQSHYNQLDSFLNEFDDGDWSANRGRVAEVEIPDSEILLQWDAPVPDSTVRLVAEYMVKHGHVADVDAAVEMMVDGGYTDNGKALYEGMSETLGGDKNASLTLGSIGIPGLEYPAGMLSGGTQHTVQIDGVPYVPNDPRVLNELAKAEGDDLVSKLDEMLDDPSFRDDHDVQHLHSAAVTGRVTLDRAPRNYVIWNDDAIQMLEFQQPASPGLTAQHNLSLDNLQFADRIGGLAVPSIGVLPEGMAMEAGSFGDITLIGDRSLADPADVPVFDSDAYTARFPEPVWGKAKVRDADRLMKKLQPFLEKFESHTRYEYFDLLVNRPDATRAINLMMRDDAVMAAFLDSVGVPVDPVMEDRAPAYPWADDSVLDAARKISDSGTVEEVHQQIAGLSDALAKAVKAYAEKNNKSQRLVRHIFENHFHDTDVESGEIGVVVDVPGVGEMSLVADPSVINSLQNYIRDVDRRGIERIDTRATREAVEAAIAGRETEFKAWVDDLVLSIMPEPKVMVGRKKMPYTVDNIVAAMTSKSVAGKEGTMTFGEGAARAAAAKRFRELEQMRQAAGEQIATGEALSQARERTKELTEEYRNKVSEYYTLTDWRGKVDIWGAMDASMKVLAEYATKKTKGRASFIASLRRNDFENVPSEVVDLGLEAADALLQAPVPYFEAKPQRAVDLSEFTAAVVPESQVEQARPLLEKHGIEVLTYDGTPESHAAAVREANARHQQTVFQQRGEAAGGYNPYTNIISLFQTADRSTFIHEMGHMMLEMNERMVNRLEQMGTDLTEQQQTIVRDFDATLAMFGVTREQWTRMDLAERRPYHEQFAAAFEAYLMEGKAPSKELRSVFRYFSQWLREFYRTIKAIITRSGAPPFGMNNDIRGLFDRMLAADEAIEAAQAEVQIEVAIDDDTALDSMVAEARQLAMEEVQAALMQEISDEQNKIRRDLAKEIRPAVEAEVDQEQVYVALDILRAKPGTELEGGGQSFKLNRASVVEILGERTPGLKKLQRLGAYSKEGGLHVDDAARLLSYRNGEVLLSALISAPTKRERINAIVADRVDAALPSMMETGEIAEAATQSLAKHRRRILQREMEILAERMGEQQDEGREKAIRALMRDRAREEIEGTNIRAIRPNDHLRNERRAAREAIEAAGRGDMAQVLILKRRQQYQQMLYREATLALDRATKARAYLKRVQNPATQKKLAQAGESYLDRVDNLLETVGLQKRSGKYEQRRQSLAEWLKQPGALDSLDAELQMELLARSEVINWEDMTLADFIDLRDAVRHIVSQASLKHRLLKNARWSQIRDAIDATVAEMEQNLPLRRLVKDRADRGLLDSIRLGMHYYDAEHRVLASLSRDAGGGQHGAFFDLFVRPLNEAATREQTMLEEKAKAFQALSREWGKDGRAITDRIGQHRREWYLSIALNWGNVDNRKRLMDGHGMTEAQVQAALDTLDATDLAYVQGIFDLIDSMWPELKEVSRRHSGVIPAKVEAEPITTAAGTIPGGYFPIVYDGDQSAAMAAMREESDAMNIVGKTLAASTRKGHRKQRGEGTGKRIQLSLDTVAQHVAAVIRDVTHTEVLYDLSRVLQDNEMGSTIDARFGPGVNRAMRKLLQDIASTQVADSKIDGWLRSMRNGVSIAVLGFRIQTVLMQTTAIGSSMRYVGKASFASAAKWVYGDLVSTDQRVKWIMDQSEFMRQRYELGRLRETREAVDELRNIPWRRKLSQAAYWAMIKYQFLTVDAPTWTAAYRNEMAQSGDHGRAVTVADQTVTDSQGGGRTVDLAGAQRSRALQLFTVFGTFFYRQYNQQREIFSDLQRNGVTLETSLKAAHDLFLVTMLNAAMVTVIKMGLGGLRGDEIDEDEIGPAVAAQLGHELLSTALGGFTGIRELTSATQGFAYSGPAGAMGLDALHSAIGQAASGNFGERFATSSMLAAGVFFKLPALQLVNLIKGLDHMIEEEDPNPAPLLLGRPRQ